MIGDYGIERGRPVLSWFKVVAHCLARALYRAGCTPIILSLLARATTPGIMSSRAIHPLPKRPTAATLASSAPSNYPPAHVQAHHQHSANPYLHNAYSAPPPPSRLAMPAPPPAQPPPQPQHPTPQPPPPPPPLTPTVAAPSPTALYQSTNSIMNLPNTLARPVPLPPALTPETELLGTSVSIPPAGDGAWFITWSHFKGSSDAARPIWTYVTSSWSSGPITSLDEGCNLIRISSSPRSIHSSDADLAPEEVIVELFTLTRREGGVVDLEMPTDGLKPCTSPFS